MIKQVLVPDVGGADEVEVIELLVASGDVVSLDDSLVVLESDKASMEIPSPFAGKIANITVAVGDKVDEGSLILEITLASDDAETSDRPEQGQNQDAEVTAVQPTPSMETEAVAAEQLVRVPDVGDAKDILVTEILAKVGDFVDVEDSIVVLESDKASMEIPTPVSGEILEILITEGQEVNEGDVIAKLKTVAIGSQNTVNALSIAISSTEPPITATHQSLPAASTVPSSSSTATAIRSEPSMLQAENVHAGPAVRKQARQYGVDISKLTGSGRHGRVLKEDIQTYVKAALANKSVDASAASSGSGIPPIPVVDFSRFGEIEIQKLSRIKKATARNLHRSWLNVPHVTQFDEADISELEAFRKSQNLEMAKAGVKLTPLAFLVKACVSALIKYPQFNASIEADYENLILKKYYNIGIAVETPDGLVVPVLKDADKKGIIEIGNECGQLAKLAREKKLPMDAMQGATFTISSLGGIGGTAFTPIVNAPEVAILGVSKSKLAPVWNGKEFDAKMMLPLSLSYDHRAIDGAEAARFTQYLSQVLSDVRRLLL